MMTEPGFVSFVQNMVVTGQPARSGQLELIDSFDEAELQADLDKCQHIYLVQRIADLEPKLHV